MENWDSMLVSSKCWSKKYWYFFVVPSIFVLAIFTWAFVETLTLVKGRGVYSSVSELRYHGRYLGDLDSLGTVYAITVSARSHFTNHIFGKCSPEVILDIIDKVQLEIKTEDHKEFYRAKSYQFQEVIPRKWFEGISYSESNIHFEGFISTKLGNTHIEGIYCPHTKAFYLCVSN